MKKIIKIIRERCGAEYQPERSQEAGPRFFCHCDKGHCGSHAVLACSAKTMKQKILIQWKNEADAK